MVVHFRDFGCSVLSYSNDAEVSRFCMSSSCYPIHRVALKWRLKCRNSTPMRAQCAGFQRFNQAPTGVWEIKSTTNPMVKTSEIGCETKSHRNVPTSPRAPIIARR